MKEQLLILSTEEFQLRVSRLRKLMVAAQIDAIHVSDNANIYYLSGRVFAGYIFVPAEGEVHFFVRRPVGLVGEGVEYIRKPEDMAARLSLAGYKNVGFELGVINYSAAQRLMKVFASNTAVDASAIMQEARSIKSEFEINQIALSGVKQEMVYRKVPQLYREGMTDVEFQIEIEHLSRLEGCLGLFRISGDSMELFMGNILAGDNADNPAPYDFAMCGAGSNPSLPVGGNGSVIKPTDSVMVDVNGNYTGYMTDMTRTFAVNQLDELALKAHQCSIDICHTLQQMMVPGAEAKALYEKAEAMACEAGLQPYFMGHNQKAGFVGHGVGIEINERPVIAPRSRDVLAAGNVIALEPKFVIPGTGAVGIENTYVVLENGAARCLTNAPEEILMFEQ